MERPYRCTTCDTIFYAEHGSVQPHHGEFHATTPAGESGLPKLLVQFCPGTGVFAGFSDAELERMNSRELGTTLTVHLNEESVWEEKGMLNPHCIPLRGSEKLEEYRRAGKIQKDEKGRDCLYSKNKQEWKQHMKDLNYGSADD